MTGKDSARIGHVDTMIGSTLQSPFLILSSLASGSSSSMSASVSGGGCLHLEALKKSHRKSPLKDATDKENTSIDLDISPQLKVLLRSYRICVRYSLMVRHRFHFHFRKNYSRESKAMAAVDEDELTEKITIQSDGHATIIDGNRATLMGSHPAVNEDGEYEPPPAAKKRKRSSIAPAMAKVIHATEMLPTAACCSCETNSSTSRLHVCLSCVFIGCWKSGHMQSHSVSKKHRFAMDFVNSTVYCFDCKDYIYDLEFDHILNAEQSRLDTLISRVREPNVERVTRPNWAPSRIEVKRILVNAKLQKCAGLRGLHNMGATCFMNSILQTFIHNPLLRAHFLSDKHNKRVCNQKNGICMACEMDQLFQNLHNGQKTPFAPISFLSSMWKSQKHLAGYSQQDGHEFLISVLNEVHHNLAGYNHDLSLQCNCIVHEVFGGVLQSDVTCLKCGTVTTALDPILDLSLDVKQPAARLGSSKLHRKEGSTDQTVYTLQSCLEKFTEPEKLGHNQYICSACGGTPQEATKQLSLRKVPPVLSIQLKRFEHSVNSSTKIDTFVHIPAELDMTRHTTRSVKIRQKLSKGRPVPLKGIPGFDTIMDGVPTYKYTLFAIVHHEGKIDTGHYKTYAKFRGNWFLFDDHTITLTTQKEALSCHAYMCFYIRDNVEYSPLIVGKSSVYTTLTSPPVETPLSRPDAIPFHPPHGQDSHAKENRHDVDEDEDVVMVGDAPVSMDADADEDDGQADEDVEGEEDDENEEST